MLSVDYLRATDGGSKFYIQKLYVDNPMQNQNLKDLFDFLFCPQNNANGLQTYFIFYCQMKKKLPGRF